VTRYKSWTLTDVAHDTWLDSFAADNDSVRLSVPHNWSLRKRTLHGGLREGIDLVEVHNGALSFAVLPTRGMSLWRGSYHGGYLGWRAPVPGPVHPKFVHQSDRGGIGWLDGFDEWMCRCGLASIGPPGEDVITDNNGQTKRTQLTLHGRIANLPADYVEVRVQLDPPHELSVIGQVEEAGFFAPHLRLTTTYTTIPGSNRLVIHDVVENRSAQATEMQMLYHCNLGAPLLEAGSRVLAPVKELVPNNARSAEGVATYETYAGPAVGFSEQCYFYDHLTDATGNTLALLHNASAQRGLALRWNRKQLPCFTVWKNTAAVEDGYVTGLEPGTNFPNFRTYERKQGRVMTLPPGGSWEARWSLEAFDTKASVAAVIEEIGRLQQQVRPMIHAQPQARWTSAVPS
jgi:hypothetical protein